MVKCWLSKYQIFLMLGVNWYNEVFLRDNPEMANKMGKGLD